MNPAMNPAIDPAATPATKPAQQSLPEQAPGHVRAILEATKETLGLLFDAEPTFGEARVSSAQTPRENEANVIVGFTGAVQGNLLLGMTRKTAQNMAGALLMEELAAFDEMAISGLAEIANIVAGACATSLHQHGFPSSITVPSVIAGDHVQVNWPNLFILETTLTLPTGTVNLSIGLKVAHG